MRRSWAVLLWHVCRRPKCRDGRWPGSSGSESGRQALLPRGRGGTGVCPAWGGRRRGLQRAQRERPVRPLPRSPRGPEETPLQAAAWRGGRRRDAPGAASPFVSAQPPGRLGRPSLPPLILTGGAPTASGRSSGAPEAPSLRPPPEARGLPQGLAGQAAQEEEVGRPSRALLLARSPVTCPSSAAVGERPRRLPPPSAGRRCPIAARGRARPAHAATCQRDAAAERPPRRPGALWEGPPAPRRRGGARGAAGLRTRSEGEVKELAVALAVGDGSAGWEKRRCFALRGLIGGTPCHGGR